MWARQQLTPVAGCTATTTTTTMMATGGAGQQVVSLAAAAAQNKRKEKARIAARARRSQEATIIMDMAHELHITQEKFRRLDKATIVKLAIDYMKAFEILCRFRSTCPGPTVSLQLLSQQQQQNNHTNIINDTTSDNEPYNRQTTNDSIAKHAIINITADDDSTKIESNQHDSNLTYGVSEPPPPTTTTTASIAAVIPTQTNANANANRYEDPPIPEFNTGSIFAHKTEEVDSLFLVIKEQNGRAAFVLKPDTEIMDEDDLTHLAPQAGDPVSLEVEPLDEIVIDSSLFKICGCRH